MKIYIAGPMRGYPEFNFPAFFEAAEHLMELGHSVFNPAERDNDHHGRDISIGNADGSLEKAAEDHGFNLREAMAADCLWICEHADAIYMLHGWEKSKGAIAERALAVTIGLKVITQGMAGFTYE